ncbi:hypothetical protein [Xanthomonas citri]|nr:hypothetical protein [Xanthomonas citri]QRD62614.1 hypothetical protein H8Z74_23255 [Xanthomonas citri pv. citri]
MTTLKYLELDITAEEADLPTPRWGHIEAADLARTPTKHFVGHGRLVRAYLRGGRRTDPDWSESQQLFASVQRLSEQLALASADARLGAARAKALRDAVAHQLQGAEQHVATLVMNDVNEDFRPYAAVAPPEENLDTWLRTAGDTGVFVTLALPGRAAADDINGLFDALSRLQPATSAPPELDATPTSALPIETPSSVQARREAIAGWLTATEAGQRIPGVSNAPDQRASRMRRQGELFAVWVPEERAYRFAPWQFDRVGNPAQALVPVLQQLRSENGVAGGRPTSGWEELEWFLAPHALADGQRPADLLLQDPAKIHELVHADFAPGAADARW